MSSRCYVNLTFEMNQPKHQGQREAQNRSVIWEAMQQAWRLRSQRKQLHALNSIDLVMRIKKFLLSTVV